MLTPPPTTTSPPGVLTNERRGTVRHELQQADKYLSLELAGCASINRREQLEFAQAAVRDALRRLDEDGDVASILVALEEIKIQDTKNPAATYIDFARAMLRRP
jgi:hypothetical protein